MKRPTIRIFALVGLLLCALPLRAQFVRGTVRSAGDNAPLNGAVVQLVDSASIERARTLTRNDGAFSLRAPAPGVYRIVTRSIGFKWTTSAAMAITRDTTLSLTLVALPSLQKRIVTLGKNPCDARLDTASAVWGLWEQATTAMLSAAIGLGDRDKQFRFLMSTRDYDLKPLALTAVSFNTVNLNGDRPWTSLPADSLALNGYVYPSENMSLYYAPDLEVLLSRSFLATHCFTVHQGNERGASAVGVDFTPSPGITHTDVQGTFWLDASSRELRTVEFTYANMPFAKRDTLAGGRIQFLRLASGDWIISDWVIRAPFGQRFLGMDQLLSRINHVSEPNARVVVPWKVRITRGNMIAAAPSGTDSANATWRRPLGSIAVRVTATVGGRAEAPFSGATVRLTRSTVHARSDASGVARVDSLVEGDYFVDVTAPWYDAMLAPAERQTVSLVSGERIELRAHIKSEFEVLHKVCGSNFDERGSVLGVLSGQLTRDGVPEAGATVTVDFPHPPNLNSQKPVEKNLKGVPKPGALTGEDMRDVQMDRSPPAKTTESGAFRFCAVPRGMGVTINVTTRDGLSVTAKTQVEQSQLYRRADIDFKAP